MVNFSYLAFYWLQLWCMLMSSPKLLYIRRLSQVMSSLNLENYLPINMNLIYMNMCFIRSAQSLSNYRRQDSNSNRKRTFVTMKCERNGNYKEHIWKLNHNHTRLRKCVCHFKLRRYLKVNNTGTFNVLCGIHNCAQCHKLVSHLIVCHHNYEKKKIIYDMTLNMVKPKTYFPL